VTDERKKKEGRGGMKMKKMRETIEGNQKKKR
jgi:hypothetical protein